MSEGRFLWHSRHCGRDGDERAVQRAVDAFQEASRPPHSAGTLHQSGPYFRSAQCPLLGNLSAELECPWADRRRSTRTRIFFANSSRTSRVVDTHGSYCFSRMPPKFSSIVYIRYRPAAAHVPCGRPVGAGGTERTARVSCWIVINY